MISDDDTPVSLKLQLLSTDFDGTLHDEQAQPPVPPALQHLIQDLQNQGVRWVINTGRDLASLNAILHQAQLRIQPDYLVVVEREVYQRTPQGYVGVDPWNRRCRDTHQTLFASVRPRLREINSWIQSRFRSMIFEDAYSPFCLIAANNHEADIIMEYLAGICREIPGLTVMRNDVYARFSHIDYHKGSALAEIGRLLGVPPERTFAAGDHLNDLPMLCRAYAQCLMTTANAVEAVKIAVRRQNGYISTASHGMGVVEGLQYFLNQHPESRRLP